MKKIIIINHTRQEARCEVGKKRSNLFIKTVNPGFQTGATSKKRKNTSVSFYGANN
jgi:hypothetical protein